MAARVASSGTGAVIKLPGSIVDSLLSFRQLSSDTTEAGGVLLGRHIKDTPHIVVDEITTPQMPDIRSRFRFFRSKRHHEIANEEWSKSHGTCAYIGSWHTHPELSPSPSGEDYDDWRKALTDDVFFGDSLYFIIVGQEELMIWEGARSGEIVPLEFMTGAAVEETI